MNTKSRLLTLLEVNRGKNISGEFIAGQLEISRTAVWKAVKELEKDGYKIKAATNRGYCLLVENDILSAQGILSHLRNTNCEEKIFVHNVLESTNITAKQMAVADAEHGTIVIADHQIAGKGRYGRSFFSPKGCGIYMSFILRPSQIWLEIPTLVTAFSAVVVCEAIETICEKSPKIKWVNDVFLDGKKICGISTEAISDFESGGIGWIVVGIGVNFTTPKEGVPEELKNIVGAVFQGKRTTTRNHLAAEIIGGISALNIAQKSNTDFLKKYRSRLMFLGEKITVTAPNQTYEATALDIDESGRLLVRMPDGEILPLSSGEVRVARG